MEERFASMSYLQLVAAREKYERILDAIDEYIMIQEDSNNSKEFENDEN